MTKKNVTLISGAAQGIGAAIAKSMAQAGHNIALNYFSSETKAYETAKECEALGSEVLLLQGDVGDPKVCKRIAEDTARKFGRIDLSSGAENSEIHAGDDM